MAISVQAFAAEEAKRAVCLGWDPVWDLQTPKRRVTIRFNAIGNERRLVRIAKVCERDYLRRIAETRAAFVAAWAAKGTPEYVAVVEFERAMCQKDLYYLCKFVLGYDKLTFHLHRPMAESMRPANMPIRRFLPDGKVVKEWDGGKPGYRGMRQFMRGGFKTTVLDIGFSVQQVLREPEVRILIKFNAEGNASLKLCEAKGHFQASPAGTDPRVAKKLPLLFPEHCAKNESEKGSGSYWRTPAARSPQQDGTLVAAGVGSTKVSQHFDIVLGDDFWDERSVGSLEVTTRTNKELDSVVYLLTSPAEGRIILIGTRYAHDDPSAKFAAADSGYDCLIVSGIMPSGRSLFPESMPLVEFQRQARANRYVFSCQVMLNPSKEDMALKVEWLRYLRRAELEAEVAAGKVAYVVRLLTDSTVSAGKGSDEAAIVALAVCSDGRRVILEAIRERMAPTEFIRRVCEAWDNWKAEVAFCQKVAQETMIQSFFQAENEKRTLAGKSDVRFLPYSLRKREKKGRITDVLQPVLMAGELYADPDDPGTTKLKGEMADHPVSQMDHLLDALAMMDDRVVSRRPEGPRAAAPAVSVDAGRRTAEEVQAAEAAQKQANAKAAFAAARGGGVGAQARKPAARHYRCAARKGWHGAA